jgi:cytochrome c oxidase assembly protein subunit 15
VSTTLVLAHAKPAGSWPRRLALATALCAVPLVLFGGSVTTLGAGMAVKGWLVAEGHFLLFFPADKWFRDTPTFVEHTHRLFGVLVGLAALACVATSWLRAERAVVRRSALVALLAVCVQGTLGGLRVLAADSSLAFLHGVLAQVVFAVLCANVVLVSPEWAQTTRATPAASVERRHLRRAALVALALGLVQVVFGAWYRHGLRPAPVEDSGLRFLLHGLGAVAVLASAATLVRRLESLRAAEPELPASLALARRVLPVLLLVQLVLGGLAWAGYRPHAIGPAEWALSIAHVLGGALLFATFGVIALWAVRLARTQGAPARPAAEAAR